MPNKSGEIKTKSARYSNWFRMYVEILDDIKVHRLTGNHFKVWVRCLALAKLNNGILPPTDVIAYRLRLSHDEASAYIDELILDGFFDVRPDGRIEPHNWSGRQFAWDGKDHTAGERKKRQRERSARSRHGRVTVEVTEVRSESVSESVSSSEVASIQEEGHSTVEGICAREVLP